MQIFKKFWRKSESSLLFIYENAVTNGTNLRAIKAMHRYERFLSLALKTQFLLLSSILKTSVDEVYYPNVFIALRIMLNCPNAVASAERSFSKLKLIKTFTRSHDRQQTILISHVVNRNFMCVLFSRIGRCHKAVFLTLHGLLPPSKDSQHLWPPADQ